MSGLGVRRVGGANDVVIDLTDAGGVTLELGGHDAGVTPDRGPAPGSVPSRSEPDEAHFEPLRSTCPLCGSSSLRPRGDRPDLLTPDAGPFRLEACADCGHLFQNPALTSAGLEHYLGRARALPPASSEVPAADARHDGRVELVGRFLARDETPRRWLDVGPGLEPCGPPAHGAFAETEFVHHGSPAERRPLAELADGDTGFDVIALHEHLEHTLDPVGELRAAFTLLRPGGHLVVEAPDPSSISAQVLGRWWAPSDEGPPQHLVSVENLEISLLDCGFAIVDAERGPAHQPADLTRVVTLAADHLARERSGESRLGIRGWTVRILARPVVRAALLADRLVARVIRRSAHGSNTFRILARRP